MTPSPFATNTTGPLAALQSQGYSLNSFTYPIDLTADPGEQHFVVFYINESSNTQFQTLNSSGQLANSGGTLVSAPGQSGQSGFQSPTPNSGQPTINAGSVTNAKRQIRRVSTAIALYMPPLIKTSYAPEWDVSEGGSFAGAIKHLQDKGKIDIAAALKELGAGAVKGALDDGQDFLRSTTGINAPLYDAASFATRSAINPNLEMLFRKVGFRSFQFDFKFTPRSEQEATNVLNIIKAFSFYASPEVRQQGAGTAKYYIYPAEFDIQFWSNGKENDFIKKISTCACTNVTVDFTASNGWSAHRPGKINGVPVETNLSLTFTELESITKIRVLQGY